MDKEHAKGALKDVQGKAKKAVGEMTDDERLKAEGEIDKAEGELRKAEGDVKDALKPKK